LGLLTLVDVMPLAAYCAAYAHWRQAEEVLHRMGEALLVKRPSGPRMNPLLRVAARAAENMLRFAGELGLTPVARSRIAAGIGPPPPHGGKLSDLLGDGRPRAG
jgi:P27 family predicted phage terminase small subunit